AVKHANTGRTTHLMARKCRKVNIELEVINRHVRQRLAGVEHSKCTDRLRATHDLLDASYRTGDIRLVSKGHDFDRIIKRERVEVDSAIIGGLVPLQGSTSTLC